jgi:WD40 repeat protein
MIRSSDPLADLVERAIVKISHRGNVGTGFFLAPGWILTCAHVLGETSAQAQTVEFTWNESRCKGILRHLLPDPCPTGPTDSPLPDLALVSHELPETRLLPLHQGYGGGDRVMSIGFLEGKGRDSLEGQCEGYREYGEAPVYRLIKFTQTQVGCGISGSPLMNRRTRAVCGVVKRTRDKESDLGGLAVPIERAIEAWPDICKATPLAAPSQPALPHNYVPRPEALDSIRRAVLSAQGGHGMALTALHGMGGIGKTVLAKALCQDEAIQRAFPDGIIWIEIGKESEIDPAERLRTALQVLDNNDEWMTYKTANEYKQRFSDLIKNKAVLIVVDDVWQPADIRPFLASSGRSRLVLTTRDYSIAAGEAEQPCSVDLLTVEQSREVLARSSDIEAPQLPVEADDLVHESGRLPLALAMIGAGLRGKPTIAWKHKLQLLRSADLEKIKANLDYKYADLHRAIQVSVDELDTKLRDRYLALAVLLEDMAAHPLVQQALWGCDAAEAYVAADQLVNLSLAHFEGMDGAIQLHDLQMDYVRARYSDQDSLRLIRGAVRLAAHVIIPDPAQFGSQMVGRLASWDDRLEIHKFCERLKEWCPRPWLRPIGRSLIPPGGPLIRTLRGHSKPVRTMVLTPDGRRAISGSLDCTARVWDLVNGRELHVLEGFKTEVNVLAVTPDGRRAISASSEQFVLRVWDVESGRVLHVLRGHERGVLDVAVTPDGSRAISGSRDDKLIVWDIESGRELYTLRGRSYNLAVVVTPDGHKLISASVDKTLTVWDLDCASKLYTLEGHSGELKTVVVTPDGRRAVSASWDHTLRVWDLDDGRELHTLEGHSDAVLGVALTPDERRVVSASKDKTLRVWDLDSGVVLHILEGHSGGVNVVAVTPDGRCAVSGSDDTTLKVWDLNSGRELSTFAGHSKYVEAVAVTPDGCRVISASMDDTLKVWELDKRAEPHILRGHSGSVEALAVTAGARRAVSASGDCTLKVWDLERNGTELCSFETKTAYPCAVVVTPDGRRAVSASFWMTLQVWDVESGRELHTLDGHPSFVYAVAVTPEGRRIISAGYDGLTVWDLNSGTQLRRLDGSSKEFERHVLTVTPDGRNVISNSLADNLTIWDWDNGNSQTLRGDSDLAKVLMGTPKGDVAVTPDGRRYSIMSRLSSDNLKVWDIDSGHEIHTLRGHLDTVRAVAIPPNGCVAVSASLDGTLKIWDIDSGDEIRTLRGHSDGVLAVAVTPDGSRVISASKDHTVRVWDLNSGHELHIFEGHSNYVYAVAVSADGSKAISTSRDQTLRVWNLASGILDATFTCDFDMKRCAWAGRRIISGDAGGRVHLLELEE